MKFDDILVHLGEFGRYQKRLYFILCIPSITAAFHALITVFIVALPEHRCAIPGLNNDTYSVKDAHHQWLINRTIIMEGGDYSQCQIYDIPEKLLKEWKYLSLTDQSKINCHRWVFDKSVFKTTTTEKMDLICADLIKRSHLNMLFQGGIMFGSLVLGSLADIVGRKKILYWSLVAQLVVGVATVWVPEYISFCFSRFLLGACGAGYFLNAFTLGIEMVAPSKRIWTGMVIEIFWVMGEFILSGLAFFIHDWQLLQMAVTIPSFCYLAFWCVIPESPRWLISNGRMADAENILQHAAEVNNVTIPEGAFESTLEDDDDQLPKVKLWQLFTHRTLLIRSLVIFLNWCVVSMVYYGLSLNSGYLYGGVHLNFFLSTVVELLAYILCLLLLDRIGRKALHASAMIIGGIACCCTIFTVLYLSEENQWVTTALALVGKLGASAAFAVIYIFSSEIFPTVIRNGSMGISSTSARVGSMASPYIADLGKIIPGSFGTALPLMVFGGASVVAGLASLSLPETLNKTLPESIEDAINFGKGERLQTGEKQLNTPVKHRNIGMRQNTETKNQNGDVFKTACGIMDISGCGIMDISGYDNPTFNLETSV